MEYKTMIRSNLNLEERTALKTIAKSKGMTLTGYTDFVLRQAIEEGQPTEAQRTERR